MRDLGYVVLMAIILSLLAFQAQAEEPQTERFELEQFYGLGIGQHRLDGATEVVGWRLTDSWYVGQREQRNAEDGLSLIWQGQHQQVSFSLDGIRLVRRF